MVGRERWGEIQRAYRVEHLTVSAIARRFDLDRKIIRRFLRQAVWRL
jgi:ActR/RegA family two-component response regulator